MADEVRQYVSRLCHQLSHSLLYTRFPGDIVASFRGPCQAVFHSLSYSLLVSVRFWGKDIRSSAGGDHLSCHFPLLSDGVASLWTRQVFKS
jgi:hypothetical protein